MSLKAERRAHRDQYLIETELAARLRDSAPAVRGHVYTDVYDELFRRVPNHPQLRVDPEDRVRVAAERLSFIKRFCDDNSDLVEIGAGDCAFSIAASEYVRSVVGLDVSAEIVSRGGARPNLRVMLVEGATLPLGTASADIVFSDQLMEHLHPDDALTQLREIRRVLRPGGRYVCITPNRVSGPHDVSGLYDDVAHGFHLREYSSVELESILRDAGFESITFYVGGAGHYIAIAKPLLHLLERSMCLLPPLIRRRVRRLTVAYLILGLNVVAR